MISLPDVTLFAVTCVNHELTVRAMNECLRHCKFGDVVLVSSEPVEAPFRVEIIPHFTGEHYAPYVCRNLARLTPTSHNLLVQYDSFIIDPTAWTDRFYDYDYIGAKWPWHPEGRRVGNSGFCFRSKKLLNVLAEIPLPPTGTWVDDELIAHTYRDELEKKHGIQIAPEDIADQFAYERHVPTRPSVGFHGMFNFWRHVSDADMETMPPLLEDFYITFVPYLEVMVRYYAAKKSGVFAAWYGRMRDLLGVEQTRAHLLHFTNNPKLIDALIQRGEWLMSEAGQQGRNSA